MDRDALLEKRRLKRRLAFWRIVAVLALVAVTGVVVGNFAKGRKMAGKDYIARIYINSIIREDLRRERLLGRIAKDEKAKALIVRINSPGGTITGSEALYINLRRVAKNKPVVAVIGSMGTSGGYIAALGADQIFARKTSFTGSIGVIFQTREYSGLMQKIGIKSESITSGKLKARPLSNEQMAPETRAYLQTLIDEAMDWFLGLVLERRKVKDAEIPKIRTGKVYTGAQALKAGLIDGFGGEMEAREWLEKTKKLDKNLAAVDMIWHRRQGWLSRILRSALQGIVPEAVRPLDGLVSLWHPGS